MIIEPRDIQRKNGKHSHTENHINNWDHLLSYNGKGHNSIV